MFRGKFMKIQHYMLCLALLLGSHSAWADSVVHCEAREQQRVECPANIAEQDVVMLQREWGQTHCQYRNNWGYYAAGIWVREGCQATFIIQRRNRSDNAAVTNQPRQAQRMPEVVRNNDHYRNRPDHPHYRGIHDDSQTHRNHRHERDDSSIEYRPYPNYPNHRDDDNDRYNERYDDNRYDNDDNNYQQHRRWQERDNVQTRGTQLRNGQRCLSAIPSNDFSQGGRVFASRCQQGGDRWQFIQGRLQHQSGQCLALANYGQHAQAPRVVLTPCAAVAEQQWSWFDQLLQHSQGYCLGANSKKQGQHVFLAPCNQTDTLRWYWE